MIEIGAGAGICALLLLLIVARLMQRQINALQIRVKDLEAMLRHLSMNQEAIGQSRKPYRTMWSEPRG